MKELLLELIKNACALEEDVMDIRKWEFVNDIYVCLEAMVNAKKCNR